MRIIYKFFNSNQLKLLDDVKQGNSSYGYSMSQALKSYNPKSIEQLEQKGLITISPDVQWGFLKLHPTVRGNNIGKTIHERLATKKRIATYLEKLSVPILSGVILILISLFLASIAK